MKAVIDPELCIGCALCVQTCPEVYKMKEDKAIVYVGEVASNLEESCKKGADECPVDAIEIKG